MRELRERAVDALPRAARYAGVGDRMMALLAALDSCYRDGPARDRAAIALARARRRRADRRRQRAVHMRRHQLPGDGRPGRRRSPPATPASRTRTRAARCSRSPPCTCGAATRYLLRGDLTDAEADLRTAVVGVRALRLRRQRARPTSAAFLALARLELGDVDGGWAALSLGAEAGSELSDAVALPPQRAAGAAARRGPRHEALAAADALRIRQEGWVEPAHAPLALGQGDRARAAAAARRGAAADRGGARSWRGARARRARSGRRCGCAAS